MVLDSLEIGLEDAETEPPPKVAISRRRFRGGRRSGQPARKRSLTEHRCPLPRPRTPASARRNGSRRDLRRWNHCPPPWWRLRHTSGRSGWRAPSASPVPTGSPCPMCRDGRAAPVWC